MSPNPETVAYYIRQLSDDIIAIESSSGSVSMCSNYHEFLGFLINSSPNLSIPHVVWSLSDLAGLIKSIIPRPALLDLESELHRATWEAAGHRYRLFVQPNKFIGINVDHRETNFYELDQFYPDDPEYHTAFDLQRLSDNLCSVFHSLGVGAITNLNSPVAVLESSGVLERAYAKIPDPSEIDPGCWEYATYCGEQAKAWCSAYQVGYFPETYSYDIASCYPGQASKLLNIQGAKYKHSRKMLPGAAYAFLRGDLTINPSHPSAWCSPIISDINDNLWGNPVGVIRNRYFTLQQINFILNRGMGEFALRDGWFVLPLPGSVRPFDDLMRYYYTLRKSLSDELFDFILKRIINGILGRLRQFRKDQPTEFTNPVYNAQILSGASLQVGDFILNNDITSSELISVNTDGFRSTRKLSLTNRQASMGQWRYDGQESALVLSGDKILTGEDADRLLAILGDNPRSTTYALGPDTYNLISIAGTVDRYFPKYPQTGHDLLSRTYLSEPFVSDGGTK